VKNNPIMTVQSPFELHCHCIRLIWDMW